MDGCRNVDIMSEEGAMDLGVCLGLVNMYVRSLHSSINQLTAHAFWHMYVHPHAHTHTSVRQS